LNKQYCQFIGQDENVSKINQFCQQLLQQNFCREDYQDLLNEKVDVYALMNDLKLWNRIDNHNNNETKSAAVKSIPKPNMVGYLSEELILLTLCSSKVSDLEKRDTLQKLMTSKSFANQHGTGCGKSVLSHIQEKAKA